MDVECPYCGHKFELCDYYEGMDNDNWIEDIECDKCEKEFDVQVEFEPIPSEYKIEIITCESCGKTGKRRNMYVKGSVFPYPKNIKETILCEKCYGSNILVDMVNN